MQITINIDETEFRQALIKQIANAVKNHATSYAFERYVADEVKKRIAAATDEIIAEELANSDAIRSAVRASLENKVKYQLTRVMKSKVAENPQ